MGTPEFRGVCGVVEPDVSRGNETHEAQSAKAVAQVGLTVPDESASHPAKRLGDGVPDATENESQTQPDVATDDVLHGVHTDDPALATEWGAEQVAKDHTRVECRVCDQAYIATTRGPGVVNATEEHDLEDQKQAADTKEDEVITDDVGHLVLVTPVLGEERGVVLQNLRATKGVPM